MTSDDGYTLIEITVAILLSGLVATSIYVVYLFGVRLHAERLASTSLAVDLHAAAVRLAQDIEEAEHVVQAATPWLVLRSGRRRTVYRADSMGLFRDTRRLLGPALLSASLTEASSCAACHELRITVASRGDTLAVRRLIRQRSPSTWRPP